jgi:hypothetical protein
VFIGPDTAANENTLASTRIHENVHYKQGFTAIGEASAGHDFFFDWADINQFDDVDMALLDNLVFTSLSESQKLSIQSWIGSEIEAYIIQLTADNNGQTCLPTSSRNLTEDVFNRYLMIQDALD